MGFNSVTSGATNYHKYWYENYEYWYEDYEYWYEDHEYWYEDYEYQYEEINIGIGDLYFRRLSLTSTVFGLLSSSKQLNY